MRLTAITLPWADNVDPGYTFDLPLKQVRALEEKCNAGVPLILMRIQTDQYRVDDFRETILQGLLGAGMSALEAAALVKKWVDDRPAKESLTVAQAILMAWIMGVPQQKKAVAPKRKKRTMTAPIVSTSVQSMEEVQQSA